MHAFPMDFKDFVISTGGIEEEGMNLTFHPEVAIPEPMEMDMDADTLLSPLTAASTTATRAPPPTPLLAEDIPSLDVADPGNELPDWVPKELGDWGLVLPPVEPLHELPEVPLSNAAVDFPVPLIPFEMPVDAFNFRDTVELDLYSDDGIGVPRAPYQEPPSLLFSPAYASSLPGDTDSSHPVPPVPVSASYSPSMDMQGMSIEHDGWDRTLLDSQLFPSISGDSQPSTSLALNPTATTVPEVHLSPISSRKRRWRFYSESDVSNVSPSREWITNLTSIPRSPFGAAGESSSSHATSSAISRPIRRASTRKNRRPSLHPRSPQHFCGCPDPTVPRSDQRYRLDTLPTELLIEIFTWACASPPTNRLVPRCSHRSISHKRKSSTFPLQAQAEFAPPKRASTDPSSSSTVPNSVPAIVDAPAAAATYTLPRRLRLAQARTILSIQLTCRRFWSIVTSNTAVDNRLWRAATLGCWGHLPKTLAEVQGADSRSQTCWRNVFGVFMRSDNGLFGRASAKGEGMSGGVEGFGGRGGWETASLSPTEGGVGMVVVQPGKDVLTARPLPSLGGYEIGLVDENDNHIFIALNSQGHFGKIHWVLPPGLRCARKGRFPPNIFRVSTDRLRIVKVSRPPYWLEDEFAPTTPIHQEILPVHATWHLTCVLAILNDPRATVAKLVELPHERIVFSTFASREGFIEGIDRPTESATIYCVSSPNHFQWSYTPPLPEHHPASSEPTPHPPTLCSLSASSTHVVALCRQNRPSRVSYTELVGRSYHILDATTGHCIKILEHPNLHWDWRHHDMPVAYNVLRHYRLRRMFNARGAGSRSTRVREDRTVVLESGQVVGGCHDYCFWVWDRGKQDAEENGDSCSVGERVFNPIRNDAGLGDPFRVLDDFYWEDNIVTPSATSDSQAKGKGKEKEVAEDMRSQWTTTAERAGWWVRTPNQVLDFWHGLSLSPDQNTLAAVRPGRLFLWELQSLSGSGHPPPPRNITNSAPYTAVSLKQRYHASTSSRKMGGGQMHGGQTEEWWTWKGLVPRAGLWVVGLDKRVSYLDIDDVRTACGVVVQSTYEEDVEEEEEEESNDENWGWYVERDLGGSASSSVFDSDDEEEDDEEDDGMVICPHRKRRRTLVGGEGMGLLDGGENGNAQEEGEEEFVFDNEKPEARTWAEMDEEGWLARVNSGEV